MIRETGRKSARRVPEGDRHRTATPTPPAGALGEMYNRHRRRRWPGRDGERLEERSRKEKLRRERRVWSGKTEMDTMETEESAISDELRKTRSGWQTGKKRRRPRAGVGRRPDRATARKARPPTGRLKHTARLHSPSARRGRGTDLEQLSNAARIQKRRCPRAPARATPATRARHRRYVLSRPRPSNDKSGRRTRSRRQPSGPRVIPRPRSSPFRQARPLATTVSHPPRRWPKDNRLSAGSRALHERPVPRAACSSPRKRSPRAAPRPRGTARPARTSAACRETLPTTLQWNQDNAIGCVRRRPLRASSRRRHRSAEGAWATSAPPQHVNSSGAPRPKPAHG